MKVYSAGSNPSGIINPKAVAAMADVGYDLSQHKGLSLVDIPDVENDVVATMGCKDACPFVRAKHRVDWNIPDPRDMDISEFHAVRDDIEVRVKAILK